MFRVYYLQQTTSAKMNSNNISMGWGDEMMMEDNKSVTEKPLTVKSLSPVYTQTCLDTEDFPSLSDFKEVTKKKRVHNTADKVKEEVKEDIKEVKEKTVICKSIKDGKECAYGNKCIYAHYLEDLIPNKCGFGDRCYRVKYNTKNVVRNVDNKNPCFFIHPEETIEMFAKRQGANPDSMKKPDPSVVYKNTRMCHSVLEGKSCENISECTYAHQLDELRILPCMFGKDCHHVINVENKYENNQDSNKKCFYIHPEEEKTNYKKRVIDTIVVGIKRDAEVAVEKIDTTNVKKPKLEEVPKLEVQQDSKDIEDVLDKVEGSDDCVVIETSKENASILASTIAAMINSGIKNLKIKIN